LDILIIDDKKIDVSLIKNKIESLTGIKTHIIVISKNELLSGLSIDPLYSLMLSKCVSKERIIFRIKRNINYKLLDLNLLKSKSLIDGFELLNGKEKYYLTFNMVAILLFISGKKLNREIVNKKIEELCKININELKENMVKNDFLKKYKEVYNKTFKTILEKINEQNEPF